MRHRETRRRYVATPELKKLIRRQGRKARWFADQVNVTQSHFSRVLHGHRDIGEAEAKLIASVLGCDFDLIWNVSRDTDSVPEGAAA